MSETEPMVSRGTEGDGTSERIYYGDGQSPRQKCGQIVSMVLVVISALLCLSLCIYRGVTKQHTHDSYPFLYFMFAATVGGLAAIHIIMVIFIKKGYISENRLWFSYLSALLVIIQSIFIEIVVMT